MKAPHIVSWSLTPWLAEALIQPAREQLMASLMPSSLGKPSPELRWRFTDLRLAGAVERAVEEVRPTLVFAHLDPTEPGFARHARLADLAERVHVRVVWVCDAKLSSEHHAEFAGLAYDLGAAWVMFPPFTRLVLEDVATGLLFTLLQKLHYTPNLPGEPQALSTRPLGQLPVRTPNRLPNRPTSDGADEAIDLATGEYDAVG